MTHYERIPEELKKLKQWVCAHSSCKIPMMATQNKAASSTDPETWDTFDIAYNAVSKGYYEYCGFVFTNNDLIGIDIDAGFDEDGLITPLAANIIDKCQSYTEKSKSGRGFHILLKGNLPFKGRNNLKGVEIYKSARYFIMTGDILLYHEIKENQKAIDYIIKTYFQDIRSKNSTYDFGSRIYSPVWKFPENNRIKLRPVYPRIPSGSRNICLTSLAGMLHNQGYNKEHIYDELVYCNSVACDPPLERSELKTICNSVSRYKR